MPMLLTDAERERFAAWLEMEADSAMETVERLSKMGPNGEISAQRQQIEAEAALLIAAKLRSVDINPPGAGQ